MIIEKTFKVNLTPKEVSDILKQHLIGVHDLDVNDVEFKITATTDDRGNYSGEELSSIICKGVC